MKKLSLTIITMAVCLIVNGQQIGQQRSRWDLGMTAAMTQVLSPRLALEKRKIDH